MKFYADKFKAIRKNKKISIKEAASLVKTNWRTIWNWENNVYVPSESKVRHLCKCLEIDLNQVTDLNAEEPMSVKDFSKPIQSLLSIVKTPDKHHMERFNILELELSKLKVDLFQTKVIVNALLGTMNTIFYLKDSNMKFITASDEFFKSLSLPINYDIFGKEDKDLFSKKDAELNTIKDLEVIRTGKALKDFENYIPGTRKQKWGLISKIPIRESNGNIVGIISSFIDITKRKKNEEIQSLLKQAFDSGPDCIFIMDKNMQKYIYISKTVETHYGYSKDRFKEKDFWLTKCLHPDDKKDEVLYLTKQIPYPTRRVFRIIKPDNTVRYIEETLQGGDNFILKVNRDITEKVKEEEIHELLRMHIDTFEYGFAIIDAEDINAPKALYMNDAIEELYGYPKETILNAGISFYMENIIHPDFRQYVIDHFTDRVREFKIIRADGKERWIRQVTYDNKYTYKGRKCYAMTIKDITLLR
jgi:PAS domain S-box-containing protein